MHAPPWTWQLCFPAREIKEDALYWLEKAQAAHGSDLIGIGKDPHFVELRSDRRFQAMVQRVGVPQ